ncbi:MAG: hypothetical protein WKF60_11850 [Ilumatobacter sp.]
MPWQRITEHDVQMLVDRRQTLEHFERLLAEPAVRVQSARDYSDRVLGIAMLIRSSAARR